MSRPNILLITTDEERLTLPTPTGFVLPSRERLAARGVSFERYYVSSAMCSSSRSVIYTGQHVPVTEIYDNDNMPYAMGSPDAPLRVQSGELRPDWRKRGFLRGYTDERYTFGRYFAPLNPNRPRDVEELLDDNDVVLYDRQTDPLETVALALDPAHRPLVEAYRQRLEGLIDAEIGADAHAWVPERPLLLGIPRWRGDAV